MSALSIDEVFGPEWQKIAFKYCPGAPKQYREMCYGEGMLDLNKRKRWNESIVPMEDQMKLNGASARQVIHFG